MNNTRLLEKSINHKDRNACQFPDWLNKLSKAVLLHLLKQMKKGTVEIVFPDHSVSTFGSRINQNPTQLRVYNDDFFSNCLMFSDIGLAESYMNGLCDTDSIREIIAWFLLNSENSTVLNESKNASRFLNLLGAINRATHRSRRNSEVNSKQNIAEHYDLGNEFFEAFLDPSMTYSSALFSKAEMTLAQAQEAKFERICRQLRLQPSDHLLEIGCGWGAFSMYAASRYGCRITAITISDRQFDCVKKLIAKNGLEDKIDLKLMDYRSIEGKFDKIVSIEMIEAVGEEFLDTYFSKIDSLLKQDGLLTLQMIICPDARYDLLRKNVDFIQKHIFPGALLPSQRRISSAMLKSGEMFLVDLFDLTNSYVTTLEQWQSNFNKNWHQIEGYGFDERFKRKWNYYFEYCQAAFDMRHISVVQATYSRPNNLTLSRTATW